MYEPSIQQSSPGLERWGRGDSHWAVAGPITKIVEMTEVSAAAEDGSTPSEELVRAL